MSKVIIAIHGLDNKPPKQTLEKWWAQAIQEGLSTHGFSDRIPAFEMVYWADVVYDKPLDENITDKNDPYYLDEKYIPTEQIILSRNLNFRKKIIDFVKAKLDKILLREDFSVKYELITNAIIHRYFKDMEDYYTTDSSGISVRNKIRERLASAIIRHRKDDIFLIAHSMGSIIAYDVLSLLPPNVSIDTFVTIGSPLGLPIIKSKIIKEQNLSFNGKPALPTPPGIKRHWFNFSDLEDGVALNYDLNDDFSPNKYGVTVKDFVVTNNYTNGKTRNPHKSYGYLRTWEFSTVLSEFLERKEKTFVQKISELFRNTINSFKKLILKSPID
jgi:hypothetical protein